MKALVIYGPTATGKTALALQLAHKYQGELISADSRQAYKGLDIGTGKVSFDARVEKHQGFWIVDGVKIHGFDLVNPPEQFTVADFLSFVQTTMIQIIGKKKLPIIVGGTGFYIKALIDGIDSVGVPANLKLRNKLEKLRISELYQQLVKIDPKRAESMNQSDRANPRRLIRAIEIAHSSLTPGVRSATTRYTPGVSQLVRSSLIIGLTAPNDYLYKRADEWLKTRLNHDMVEEVKNLLDKGVEPVWLDNLGLEYRWITRYLLGKIDQPLAIERLKGDTHNFIRRQKTWFKQFKDDLPAGRQVKMFDISQPEWRRNLENRVKDWYIS